MKKQNVFAHEYRTPVCKLVRVHVEGLVCNSYGEAGGAGDTGSLLGSDADGEDY